MSMQLVFSHERSALLQSIALTMRCAFTLWEDEMTKPTERRYRPPMDLSGHHSLRTPLVDNFCLAEKAVINTSIADVGAAQRLAGDPQAGPLARFRVQSTA